ncbi:hypothetical protein FQZ97_722860 [compost metagenome]
MQAARRLHLAAFVRYGQQLIEVAFEDGPHFVDGHLRIGAGQLRAAVLGGLAAAVAADAAVGVGDEVVEGAFQRADARGAHGAHEDLRERQAVQRQVVDSKARAGAHGAIDGAVGAVAGDEHVVDDDIVAAGGAQAQHVPVAHDPVVGARQQEGAVVVSAAGFGGRYQSTQEDPVAQFAAAGELPVAGEAVAAFDRGDLADRHVGRGDQRSGVITPDLLLRAFIEQGQLPVVHADHAVDPGGGHAAPGQRHLDAEEGLRVEFIATVAARLQHLEKARSLHVRDGFGGDACFGLCLRGAFGQHGDHLPGARDQACGQLLGVVVVRHRGLLFAFVLCWR